MGAGISLVTRLAMLSRPAGKSAGNSRLHVTVGSRVNDDFPAVPWVTLFREAQIEGSVYAMKQLRTCTAQKLLYHAYCVVNGGKLLNNNDF